MQKILLQFFFSSILISEIIQILSIFFRDVMCVKWNLIIIHFRVCLFSATAEDHHVHFDDNIKDDFEEDHSNPVIQKGQQGKINIHLGFLQVKHRYRVELNIPVKILEEYKTPEHKLVLKVDDNDVPNINCKLLSFKGDAEQSQFYEAEIEFFAHKEKLLKEEMKLLTNDEKSVKFVFSARVLGRGKLIFKKKILRVFEAESKSFCNFEAKFKSFCNVFFNIA